MYFNQMGTGLTIPIMSDNPVRGLQYHSMSYSYESYTTGPLPRLSLPLDTALSYLRKYVLPSPPELMIGRDKEKADIVDILLHKPPARVAILGGGGMGKTTLALSILHEDAIVERYPSRYFFSCDGLKSLSSLVDEIADALRIPPANRGAFLIDTVSKSFPHRTLLFLDNFETLWDNEAKRSDVREFLSLLHRWVSGLIITMRGAQRPSGVPWSKHFLSPLQPLTKDISRLIFEEMTKDSVDEFAGKLLTAVDGIPLAISLISALLREGLESSESLWSRWTKTGSIALGSGEKHRLSNLDTSIHLSVFGPRMRADPTTIDILAMLSVLPDGFPDEESAVEELQSHLPEGYNLPEALLTMQQVSLVHVDGTTVPRRLRMLSPIQFFCQRMLKGSEELRNSITSFYVQMMDRFPNPADPDGHAIIPNELRNVLAVLMQAWRRGKGDASLTVASIEFTSWSTYLGNHAEEGIYSAMQGAVGEPGFQGNCHYLAGEVHLQQSKLDEAETSFKHAVRLHQQAYDVLGEGGDIYKLGEVHLRREQLDEAEVLFRRAAELHTQVRYVLGEGNDTHKLGEVHLRRDQLDEAEVSFRRAAELHRQAPNVLGEGNDIHKLGRLFLRRSNLDESEASFRRAAELHHQARDVLGEGDDLQKLGRVHLRRDQLGEAEALFIHAARLHQQAHNILGEENDLWMLERVHLRRSKLRQINNLAT